jgi:hypothetical protein
MWLFKPSPNEAHITKQHDIVRLNTKYNNSAVTMPLDKIIEGILDDKKIINQRLEDIAILVAKQIRAIELEILHSKNPDDPIENKYLIKNKNLANENLNNLILLIYNLGKKISNSIEIAINVLFFYESLIKDYNENLKIQETDHNKNLKIKETDSQTLINLYDFKKLYLRKYAVDDNVQNYFGKR